MTDIKVGDQVKLTAGPGPSGGPYEVVRVSDGHLSLKRDHIIIHNVHPEDVAPAAPRREMVSA